jgi:ribosome-associated protein
VKGASDVPQAGSKVAINQRYFVFRYSRSEGPGGQNVNKLNTKVTLLFDVQNCPDLSESQKQRILRKLASRIDKTGRLAVSSQRYRTQSANKKDAVARFVSLIDWALRTRPPRIKTAVPKAQKEKRLAEKKKRGQIKMLRTTPALDE